MRSSRRLLKDKRGSALIEFAMLAPVFFFLVVGLVEFVVFQYQAYALSYVTYEAARVLQTGKVSTSNNMLQTFQNQVCATAATMIDCTQIVFDVRSFDTLSAASYPPPVFDSNGNVTNFVFQPGTANQYSVVRSAIHYSFVTPFMGQLFGMGPGLPALINSYCIVRNEPWA